jgi:hypothetical protein
MKKGLTMEAEMKGKIQSGVGGLICGASIATFIGFNWGGWSTIGATQKISDKAVLTSQAAICVAQFVKEPNSAKYLKELAGIESYNRSEYIEKGGWDKMPGQKEASSGVSSACADGLEVLIKK